MGDLREENGVVVLENGLSNLGCGEREVWDRAEAEAWEIIRQVQPTVVSEERRRDVVDYVQRLLKGYLGCEVFPFGSVPLKTYLPDGDLDLTAFCGFNVEEAFANDVYSVLVSEDLNPTAKFVVKDVQYIRAEVKLVKCLVQNIVVDISFNQIGGLCTLGFLEEIDRLIGKDHLFKRSIILIKAWCYYESRILGAHHGLISTYALETLVLYIFHLFHTSLDGPLAVLHKFLDYFSKFDWENLCVSLSGPIRLASLPEIVEGRGDGLTEGRGDGDRSNEDKSENSIAVSANAVSTGIVKAYGTSDHSYSGEWLIDTGCSYHVIGDLKLLSNVRSIPPRAVGLPYGSRTMAKHAGCARVTPRMVLDSVLYVPSLNCNLISASQLSVVLNCEVITNSI